jgi:hypothetical protein
VHATILLLAFWAVAFLSLCAAVALLGIFYSLIETDLALHSLGKEVVVAGIASHIEGMGVWLIVLFIPVSSRALALRSMIIPTIAVALIYKIVHLEDWSRYETILLLVFQIAIGCLVTSLVFGRFEAALFIAVGFGVALAVIAGVARNL